MTRRCRPHSGREHRKRVDKPVGELGRRQRPAAGRRQLDRQRDAVQHAAHPSDGVRVARADHEAGRGQRRPVGEQPDRIGLGERRHLPGHLPRHPEHLPAGGQQAEPRRGAEQAVRELRGRRRYVLAVVQDQQPVEVGRVPLEPFGQRRARNLTGTDRARHGAPYELRLRAGVEGHKPAGVGLAFCRGQRQPCFPGAAGPEECQQASLAEQAFHLRQLPLATDESGQPGGQRKMHRPAGAGLPGGGQHQLGAIAGVEAERLGENAQREGPRPSAPAPLQRRDRVRAEPGPLRQRLLCQPGSDPEPPQHHPECPRRVVAHTANYSRPAARLTVFCAGIVRALSGC